MRLTHKHKYKKDSQRFVFDMKDYRKACQKLGRYEDIDESPEHLAKIKKAFEIIKETPMFAWYITIYENAYEMVSDAKGFRVNNSVEELQEMFDLLKEVML